MAKLSIHDPVDDHIGRRIRLRRKQLGVSQTQLAKAINLTFQQVQKYEIGGNRVSASTLFKIAARLSVPISFFFDGLNGSPEQDEAGDGGVTALVALRAAMVLPKVLKAKDLPRREQRAIATIIQALFEKG